MAVMTNQEVHAIMLEACEANGRPDIMDRIRWKWSARLTSSMGNASKRGGDEKYTIKLSTPLFDRADYATCRQTVIHEVCHVIDGIVNGVRMSHGYGWKHCMARAGVPADRCHTVSNAGLVKRYVYTCPNGCHEFRLSTVLHNKIRRGQRRVCNKCRSAISFTGRMG